MLSKKYYETIAGAINKSQTKTGIISGLCEVFRQDNFKFSTDKFIDACYKNGREIKK